ncbi:hypothetical protein BASA50_004201 [Batrachochytrium salamandrivorans]|uniref:Proteasome inhibitor PI31 subunit n=1 Tax=Batrachochytrium salamandrivorans TaxID=1357716 RepID=A0ABQ8FJ74_9FUNG|nr:hypothetical protein BASA62_009399 [Batrachochytrium salamandrivorans]KAH6568338.1 hypothetical protein BASA60_008641 [Batrachochytrium salamandrivorans]KAH6597857.1 hypothetical protein BASA50_004201 [Batrachochytrium salamandrivorans]KAH6598800.1 hypothetical protein BASA61_002786 [Batrachochytrium salamandrivorans]KAH9269375.1 hypothetical protein BASA83_008602 [Batrachochytrium salamandrivorans]
MQSISKPGPATTTSTAADAHVEDPLAPECVLATLEQVLCHTGASTTALEASTTAGASTAVAATTVASVRDGLQSPSDLAVAVLHAVLVCLGFHSCSLAESAESPTISNSCPLASPTARDYSMLPSGWNAVAGMYSLNYSHPQSKSTFVIKSLTLGNRLMVHAMNVQDGAIFSMQLDLADTISPEFTFPYNLPFAPTTSTTAPHQRAWDSFPLALALVSKESLELVASQFRTDIAQQLVPKLSNQKYQGAPNSKIVHALYESGAKPASSLSNRDIPPISRPTLHNADHRDGDSSRSPIPPMPHPYGVGDVDLDPLAAAPAMMPPVFGGSRLYGGPMHPGGGMLVGPDHPMFGGGDLRGRGGYGGESGLPHRMGGGPVRFPPGAVPPGARFDPVGPFGHRPDGGSVLGGGRGRVFSGDPDNDDLIPPGYNDMFM